MPTFENFDHVRLSDGRIFAIIDDVFHDDRIGGIPLFEPADDGDRDLAVRPAVKVPRDGSAPIKGDLYGPDPRHFMAVSFPESAIVEQVKPVADLDTIRAGMDPALSDLVGDIIAATIDIDTGIGIIGSDTYGLRYPDSDMDVLVAGATRDSLIETHQAAIEGTVLERFPRDRMDPKVSKYAEAFGIPEDVSVDHVGQPERRTVWSDGDMKVSFIPGQRPGTWTDHHVPTHDAASTPVTDLTGTVVGTDHSVHRPREYVIETGEGDRLSVLSHYFVFCGSFQEGDRVRVTGDLFTDADTIYCREQGHYIGRARDA